MKTKSKIAVIAGVGVLVVAGIAVALVLRHKDPVADGKRAVAKRLAVPADLTTKYTTPASYFPKITSFPAWATVPTGFQVFDNVPLQIDGMMCLWGEANATQLHINFPKQILGIEMNQKFETLYVYHGAFFQAPKKTPVCEVVFRYDDGSSVTNQLLYGDDMIDWGANNGRTVKPTSPRSKIAWIGGSFSSNKNQPVCFCLTAIENPYPTREVATVDLYSSQNRAAACILAMTPGEAGLMK